MDADPLRAARPEEGQEKPKGAESQDDGYESNSGEARRAEPEPQPAEPPAPPPPPLLPPQPPPPQPPPDQYEPMMRHYQSPYRQFDQDEPYQHFPFPKYSNDPYTFKREDAPYDMSHHQHQYKREDDVYNGVKRECEDPYSFVEEEAMSMMLSAQHSAHHQPPHDHHMMHQQMMLNQPKKRGRKKKIKDENGMEIKAEPGMEGVVPRPVKERKKHDRFNGMSEEEVARRTLPDHLAENLDIIIIGINPGLFAAYKGHHYAGPGNHFWKCLYLSGLTREQMSADEDYKLLNFGIGFTNMVPRPTKGSADLTRREIKEGSAVLLEKLQTFRPKVAVFNGKLIYEVFSGKKDFCFGKQPDTIAGTNTYMWVMPSSSARCAQLPRAADKVPFYAALKKFRDYLNGLVAHVDESELVFPDTTARRPHEEMEIRRLTMEPEPGDTIILEDGTEVPLKKKRGRPKKVKLENGEVVAPAPRAPRAPRPPPALGPNGEEPPKKKRGRPKKIRPDDTQIYMQQQQQQQQQSNMQLQQGMGGAGGAVGGVGGVAPVGAVGGVGGGMGALGHDPHEHEYMGQMQFPNMDQQPMYDHDNYYQQQHQGGNQMETNSGMEMSPMGGMQRGYASPGPPTPAGGAGGAAGAGGTAGYAASPRAVYHSPRSQGYSPGPPPHPAPPRHQPTPQPQQFPSSPGGASVYNSARLGGALARSPLYAASPHPAPYPHSPHPPHAAPHPAPHPAPRYHSPQYSRSPAPRPYSRSPAPAPGSGSGGGGTGGGGGAGGGGAAFGAASPAGALHSYTPSPQHTPYSQHSSPQPATNTAYPTDIPHYNQGGSTGSASAGSGSFGAELSSEIGAAISSPPAVSPALAVDFEPPHDARDSPLTAGSTDMHPGSNSNSSLSDYNKTNSQAGSEMSPAGNVGGVVGGAGFGSALYEGEARYHLHSSPANMDKDYHHYQQEHQGSSGVGDSPRLDSMHQHQSMYPSNFNRSTPDGVGGVEQGFRPAAPPDPPHTPHTPHHQHPGSPASYGENKPKSQDVASKSLSGLESLVDQIPSIAEGPAGSVGGVGAVGVAGAGGGVGGVGGGEQPAPAPVPALPEYAPALYGPYSAYGGAAYGNNGYGGPFVGYGGGYVGGLMRPTPGYLSEWQYGYTTSVPAVSVPASYHYNNPYYNGYTPPPAHSTQTHYLSAPPLLELHKNGEHSAAAVPAVPSVPSVGFGGFC